MLRRQRRHRADHHSADAEDLQRRRADPGGASPIKLQLKDNVLDLDETERILNGTSSFLSTQVEALRSRDVAERAIRSFHLAENAAFTESDRSGAALAAAPIALPPAVLYPRGMEQIDPGNAGPAGQRRSESIPNCSTGTWATSRSVTCAGPISSKCASPAPDPALAAFLTAAHIQAYLGSTIEVTGSDCAAKGFLASQLDESPSN